MNPRFTFQFQFEKTKNLDETIISYLLNEKTNTEIANETGYSMGYIKRRLSYLFKLYGVKTKVGLVREILRLDQTW